MRKLRQTELPRFDSMAQAAAATFIPLAVIKRAKAAGCTAFVGSRVDLAPLLKFIFEQDGTADDLPALQLENMRLVNSKLAAQTAILEKLWCPKADVFQWGAQLGYAIRRVVEGLHLHAPNLAGLNTAAVSNALKAHEAEIMRQLHSLPDAAATWATQSDSSEAAAIIAEQAKPSKRDAIRKILNPAPAT